MQLTSHKVPVSLSIRTLNEERCLQMVLEAARELTDDMLLVDSGSTDRTLEIARECGARVISQKWLGYGHQKRVGEDHCRYDWVLDLDADEIVSPELADDIRSIFRNGPPEEIAFSLRQTQVFPSGFCHPKMGTSLRMKLYNRTKVRIPADAVWDQFSLPKGAKAPVLNGPLWHFGFNTFSSLFRKQDSATTHYMKGMPKRPLYDLYARILFGFPLYLSKKFFLQGGWRGGVEGFIFSAVCALSSWLKIVKLYERDYMKTQTPQEAVQSVKTVSEQVRRAA